MIDGHSKIIAHVGYPTESFKAPMIYNPWFESRAINAVVVPMGVKREDFVKAFPPITRFTNFHGALITMPHKTAVVDLLDEASTAVKVAGSCNAVRRDTAGRLIGDMFDGEGFVRGLKRHGETVVDRTALVIGAGGVGSAIAASIAAAGAKSIALYDVNAASADTLAERLAHHYPGLRVSVGSNDPSDFDLVVNATPLGMNPGDPMPLDISRLSQKTFVGEVVMKQERTPFLAAAIARGCRTQVGIDMLFEQIPAYLEFFGFPPTNADELRSLATIAY
jgi:shikimate dehydrogenase